MKGAGPSSADPSCLHVFSQLLKLLCFVSLLVSSVSQFVT